jgi:hypothetical protein
MAESSKIIAINTDPGAPMFQIAHYRIVGDAAKVVPMIIKALRERSADDATAWGAAEATGEAAADAAGEPTAEGAAR